MPDLRDQLDRCLRGRVCLIGLGNVDYGDDGFGVRLAEELAARDVGDVVTAGKTPERFLGRIADSGFDSVVFLDAVEFGGAPGSIILLNSSEMTTRFPQVSTHKIALGLLAKWAEANGSTRAWLLGVQPELLKAGNQLSTTLHITHNALAQLLCEILPTRSAVVGGSVRPDEELTV